MTIQIDENLLRSPIFREHTTFCLYIYLTTHAESNGQISISKNSLKKAMRMGFIKITQALDSLESKGYIVRLNKDANKATAIYQISTSIHPTGMHPTSNLEQASLNTRQGSLEMMQGSLETKQGSLDMTQGSLDTRQGSLEMTQGSLEMKQGSLNTRQGSLNTELSSSEMTQGSLETKQGSPEDEAAVHALALACARYFFNNKYILFNQDIIQSNREGLSNREKDRVIEKGVIGEKEEETERGKKERVGKERENNSSIENKEPEQSTVKKTRTKRPPLSYDFVAPELSEAYTGFVKMRKAIGHPIKTQRCLESNYNEALKLADNDLELAKKIIEQSTDNEWKGLFPLKEAQPRKGLKWGSDTEQRKDLKWSANQDRPYPRMFFNSDVEEYDEGV